MVQTAYKTKESIENGCHRVANYLRKAIAPHIQWWNLSENDLAKARNTPFAHIEFHIVFFPMVTELYDFRLRQAIAGYDKALVSASELRAVVDEWIKAHTIIWSEGVGAWQVVKLESFKETRLYAKWNPVQSAATEAPEQVSFKFN